MPTCFRHRRLVKILPAGAVLLLAIFAASFPFKTSAAADRTLPFAARLMNLAGDGTVPDGNYGITFSLYNVETGGTPLWRETQTIPAANGNVSTMLGLVTPIPDAVTFSDGNYYLGLQVGTDSEMAPRRRIGSIPSAFNADTVDGLHVGSTPNSVLLVDGTGSIGIQGGASFGGALTVGGSITPTTAGANLGSSTHHFATLFVDDLNVSSSSLSGTNSLDFTINTNQAANNTDIAGLRFYLGPTLNTYAALQWNGPANRFDLLSRENGTVAADLSLGHLVHGAAVLSLPTSSDTLVGLATTDTLSNKTLTSSTLNGGTVVGTLTGGISDSLSGFGTISGTTLNGTTVAATTMNTGSLSATGNIGIGGGLTVTGNSSLNSLSTSGLATLNSLSVSNAATVGTTLGVTGATTLSSDLLANANVTLGTSTANTLTINGALNSNVTPALSGMYDLGSTSKHFKNLYVDNAVFATTSTPNTTSPSFVINSGTAVDADSNLQFYRGASLPGANIGWDSTNSRLYADKNIIVQGNTTLGNAATNSTTVRGSLTMSDSSSTHQLVFGTSNPVAVWQDSANTLGINGDLLHTNVAAATSGATTQNSRADLFQGSYWNGATATNVNAGIVLLVQNTTPTYGLALQTAGSTRLYVSQAGNVGINTLVPSGKLDVIGTPASSASTGVFNLGSAAFNGAAGSFAGSASGTQLAVNAATGFAGNLSDLQVNGVSKFKVDASGNITASGTISNATISGGTYSNTAATGTGAYGLVAQGGNITLQASTGIINLNQASVQNSLRVFASDGTNYAQLTNDGTNTVLSSTNGAVQIVGAGTNQVVLGDASTAMNLSYAHSANINGQGSNPITLGQSGDVFNLNTSGATYNVGTLTSVGATLATTATGSTSLVVNGPTGLTSNLLDLQVNGTSKLSVNAAGSLTTAANVSATGNLSVTGSTAVAGLAASGTVAGNASSAAFTANSAAATAFQATSSPTTSATLVQLGGALGSPIAAGTFLGINPATFTGNFADFQVNGTSKFKVDSTGLITLSGSTYSGTAATGAAAYSVVAQGGNINLQASTGIIALNLASAQNYLKVYAADNANYAQLTNDGTNTVLSSTNGAVQIVGAGTNQVVLGDASTAMNLSYAHAANINGQGANPITFGQSGDVFNLNTSGATYNVGTLTSVGATLATSATGSTALLVNGPTGLTANLLDLQVNGTSKLNVSAAGNLTVVGNLAAVTETGNITLPNNSTGLVWTTENGASVTAYRNQLSLYGSGSGIDVNRVGIGDIYFGRPITAGSISITGSYTQSGTGANVLSGGTTLSASGTALAVTNNATIGGTLGVTGTTTVAGVVASGTIAGNASSAAFTANSATATAFQATSSPTTSATLVQLGSALGSPNSAGTFIGINPTTFTGNFADFQVNGTTKFKVDSTGAITGAALSVTNATVTSTLTTATITSTGALAITSAANGNINISPNGSGKVTFGDGGTTNYAAFDNNGALTFNGAARPYSELTLVPNDANFPASGNCSLSSATTGSDSTNPIVYKTVDCDATNKDAFWDFKMPSNYVTGSNIQVDVYWISSATSGAATWDAGYVGVPASSAWNSAAITNVAGGLTTVSVTAKAVNDSTVVLPTPSVMPDDSVSLRVRNSANTLSATASVLRVRVRYIVNN